MSFSITGVFNENKYVQNNIPEFQYRMLYS